MPAGTESADDPKGSAKGLDYEDKKILAVLATFDDSIPAKTAAQISGFDLAETEKRLNKLHFLGNISVYESEGAPLYLYNNNGLPDAVYKKIVLEHAKKDEDDLEKKHTIEIGKRRARAARVKKKRSITRLNALRIK